MRPFFDDQDEENPYRPNWPCRFLFIACALIAVGASAWYASGRPERRAERDEARRVFMETCVAETGGQEKRCDALWRWRK